VTLGCSLVATAYLSKLYLFGSSACEPIACRRLGPAVAGLVPAGLTLHCLLRGPSGRHPTTLWAFRFSMRRNLCHWCEGMGVRFLFKHSGPICLCVSGRLSDVQPAPGRSAPGRLWKLSSPPASKDLFSFSWEKFGVGLRLFFEFYSGIRFARERWGPAGLAKRGGLPTEGCAS
jgi:hypothetical protein